MPQGLYDLGIIDEVEYASIPKDSSGRPYAGGVFSVDKKGLPPVGIEMLQRLIFNLKCNNSIQRPVVADLFQLPVGCVYDKIQLSRDEYALVSAEDVRSAFYLYALPVAWRRFLAVARGAVAAAQTHWRGVGEQDA